VQVVVGEKVLHEAEVCVLSIAPPSYDGSVAAGCVPAVALELGEIPFCARKHSLAHTHAQRLLRAHARICTCTRACAVDFECIGAWTNTGDGWISCGARHTAIGARPQRVPTRNLRGARLRYGYAAAARLPASSAASARSLRRRLSARRSAIGWR
jgi:hypothetical protein